MSSRGSKVNSHHAVRLATGANSHVILFIKLPWTGHAKAFELLRTALGEEAVGWVGKTVGRGRLANGPEGLHHSLVGGTIDLAGIDLSGFSLVATVLPDPDTIPIAEYTAARYRPTHRHHAIANTLSLEEVLAERHPFSRDLVNVATRSLTVRGQPISADSVLKTLASRPSLVGLSAHAAEFAAALAGALGVPAATIPQEAFATPERPEPPVEVARALARYNAADRKLTRAVAERLDPATRVWHSGASAAAG